MDDTSTISINNSATQALQHQSPFRKWAGLGVLSLGLAIVIIDTTLLNVSLATIIKDLNTDLQSLQWVITSYALVLAAFTITGGRLGDLFGRKKMFMLGAVIFAVGSFMASVSHTVPILLLGESIIEGFGAALMMPATASLVVANFSGKDRATAFGIWGGVAGASSAIGPLLGGYLTTHYSWRWGFRINIFIAAVVLIGSLWLLKESRDERKPKLDWGGVALSALGLLGITFAIIESATLGWWHAKKAFEIFGHSLSLGSLSLVPVTLFAGFIFLALFFWWEKRMEDQGKSPLVSMNLLKNRQFTSGVLTVSILTLGMTGMIFALPVFLQTAKKLDAFHTGLVLLPLSLAILIIAPISGLLSKKITPKYLIQAGLIIDVIAALIIRANISVDVPLSHLIPGLALYGLGMGLVFPPISNLILSAAPVEMAGEASGVNNTLRQVGSTLGAAIIGAALLTAFTTYFVAGLQASSVLPQSIKQQIVEKVSDPNSNAQFSLDASLPAQIPPVISQEIEQLANESSAQATKDAYVYSALFAFLCFVVALFLPTTSVHEHEPSAQPHEEHSGRKYALASLLIILATAGALTLLHQSNKKVIATGLVDINAIRSVFQPTSNDPNVQSTQTSPQVSTPAPASLPAPAPQPTVSPIGISPRGQLPAQPAVITKTYTNQDVGFQTQLSSLWQANELTDHHMVVFANSQGENVSVQSYDSPAEGLSLVETQLKGSPSVQSVSQTTFLGEPALKFQANGGQGLAVIHAGRLYYILGASITAGPLAKFTFL